MNNFEKYKDYTSRSWW